MENKTDLFDLGEGRKIEEKQVFYSTLKDYNVFSLLTLLQNWSTTALFIGYISTYSYYKSLLIIYS